MTSDMVPPEMELFLEENSHAITLPMIEPGLEAVLSTLRQGDFVAQGGQAQVHRVTQGEVDVAARSVSFQEADEQGKRLEREARVIRGLDHPNIVGYRGYEVNTVQKRWGQDIEYTFYMDWIKGPTLKDILQPGEQHRELSGTEIDAIFAQVASALSYCHERGILHRDIKPSNLKLTDENCVKVLDFGLVKKIGETTMTASEGRFLGTYTYAAPEVRNGKKAEAASDWYSAAVMTVELLAGMPYEGVIDPVDVLEKLQKIKHAPVRLRETLELLLEEDPGIRVQNIERVKTLYRLDGAALEVEDLESASTLDGQISENRNEIDNARSYWDKMVDNNRFPIIFYSVLTAVESVTGIAFLSGDSSISMYCSLPFFIKAGSSVIFSLSSALENKMYQKHLALLETDPGRALVLYDRDKIAPRGLVERIKYVYQDWREEKGKEWVQKTDPPEVRAKLQSYCNRKELSSNTIRRRVLPALSAEDYGTRQLAVEIILKHDPQLEYQSQLEEVTRLYGRFSAPLAYQSFIQVLELCDEGCRRELIHTHLISHVGSSEKKLHQTAKNMLRLLNGRANGAYTPLLEEARERAVTEEAMSKYGGSTAFENYKGLP